MDKRFAALKHKPTWMKSAPKDLYAVMTGFMEWLGRVVMLVLAGMITLSIIGAIAAIPSGSIETRFGAEPSNQPLPSEEALLPSAADPPTPPAQEARPASGGGTQLVTASRPQKAPTAAEWLEAITYALLAIVGLAAVGILLLWRAVHHWRRGADALEILASTRR